VVDTGSTDETRDIARRAGAELHTFEWPGSFSAARNETLRHARGDWILILDGDEVLADGAADRLAELDLGPDGPGAWSIEVVNFATDRESDDEATFQRQVRLFRNRPHYRYQGIVHNQLRDLRSGLTLDGPAAGVRVLHYGYTPSVWSAQGKDGRLTLLEQAVEQDPGDRFARHNLANHLKILERYEEAFELWRAVCDGAPSPKASDWEEQAFFGAAFCAVRSGHHADAIELCDRLLAVDPGHADGHLRRAEALLELGRPREVVDALGALLTDPNRHAVKRSALSFGVPYRLARALVLLDRFEEARPLFDELAAGGTDDHTVYTHVALCAANLGDLAAAREALGKASALAPDAHDVQRLAAAIARGPAPLRVALVGDDAQPMVDALTGVLLHVLIPTARDARDLGTPDLIHLAADPARWPGLDWDTLLRPDNTLVHGDGSFDLRPFADRGFVVVDGELPPQRVGERLEPVLDVDQLPSVRPPLPLRIHTGDPAQRTTLRALCEGLPIEVETSAEPSARLHCHLAWCLDAGPPEVLTALALGQVVLAPTTKTERAVYPGRPVLPPERSTLEALAAAPEKAIELGTAARHWVRETHSPRAVAARLVALYERVLRPPSVRTQ